MFWDRTWTSFNQSTNKTIWTTNGLKKKKKRPVCFRHLPNRNRSEMCWVIYYKRFASSSKCITALLNLKAENECKEMQRCSKSAWTHHERPGLQIATQQDLCTSHSTSALPFLSRIFHHLSFFKPLPSLRRESSGSRCAVVSINALQTCLADALLIHSRALPGQGPASRCVMLPCAQRNGVKPWNHLPVLAKPLLQPLLQPDPLRRSRLTQFGVWFFLLPQELPLSFNF